MFRIVDSSAEKWTYPLVNFSLVSLNSAGLTTAKLSIGYLQLSTQKPGVIYTKIYQLFSSGMINSGISISISGSFSFFGIPVSGMGLMLRAVFDQPAFKVNSFDWFVGLI